MSNRNGDSGSEYPIMRQEHASEAALLTQVLLQPKLYAQIMQGLPPEAFDHPHHRKIAALVERRHRSGEPWDVLMVMNELSQKIVRDDRVDEELKMVFITLSELSSPVPTSMEALAFHLHRVRGAQEKRALTELLDKSLKDLMNDDLSTPEILARVDQFRSAFPGGSPFSKRLAECVFTDAELRDRTVPERPPLMGEFFKEGDLGFIYAPRGAGKTWLTMMLANARAQNRPLGRWNAGAQAGRILYVDGEMHLADTKARSLAISSASQEFLWLHGDEVFSATGKTINLCEREWQEHLTGLCRKFKITELYLDNLSCLVRGVEENDNDHWRERMLPWLLEMRRMKVSVVIVAHAGRAEHMRGASGKEDQALWVLKLKPAEEDLQREGAAFITEFTKSRNTRGTPPPLLWRLTTPLGQPDGPLTIACEPNGGVEDLVRHVQAGVSKNRELAELLGVAAGTVSKWAKRAVEEGKIEIRGREYFPLQRLDEVFPD